MCLNTLFSTYCTLLLLLYAPPFLTIFTKLIVLRSEACSDWPAFVASSGDMITDYNDLYCLFTCCVASRHVNITMSASVIGEMTNNKCYSTLLKTHVWIVSSRNVLTGCESEVLDCPCKVAIAPLYRNSLCASQHCRLLFQVQEIVLHKMRFTVHTL